MYICMLSCFHIRYIYVLSYHAYLYIIMHMNIFLQLLCNICLITRSDWSDLTKLRVVVGIACELALHFNTLAYRVPFRSCSSHKSNQSMRNILYMYKYYICIVLLSQLNSQTLATHLTDFEK